MRENSKRKGEKLMAGIDTSTIEGYAEMTAEQKVEALEKYTIADPDYSGYVKKEKGAQKSLNRMVEAFLSIED